MYSHLRPSPAPDKPVSVVLTYHSVGTGPLALPSDVFRRQMEWLKQNTSVVSLSELVKGQIQSSKAGIVCAITFDDGYASVHRYALPILREVGLPATIYLVAGAIGDHERKSSSQFDGLYPNEDMLIWQEASELQANGVQLGSHLVHHKDLTALDAATASEELAMSKRLIEDKSGAQCASFCYPWGKHNQRTIEAVRKAGYGNAVTAIQDRWNGIPHDPFQIPRADIRRDYTIDDFAAVVRGDWDFLGYIQRFRRWMN